MILLIKMKMKIIMQVINNYKMNNNKIKSKTLKKLIIFKIIVS